MKLRYKLTGSGWAEAVLEDEQSAVTVSASYLSDALGSLARSALAVFRGSGEVRFSFDEEPGEYRWVLKKKEAQSYSLTILLFTELWGNKPDGDGKVVFEREFSSIEYAKMVLKTLENVRHEYGDAGYKAKWHEHDFPSKELDELHSLLDQKEPIQIITAQRASRVAD